MKKKSELKGIKNENCVQCHSKLKHSYGFTSEDLSEPISYPFCSNPSCPNYALLQTGVLPKEK